MHRPGTAAIGRAAERAPPGGGKLEGDLEEEMIKAVKEELER